MKRLALLLPLLALAAAPARAEDPATDAAGEIEGPISDLPPKPVEAREVVIAGRYRPGPRSRLPGERTKALARWGASASGPAVLRALRWLETQQLDDGSWPGNPVAATALALWTYLDHGDLPGGDAEFGPAVERAVRFLAGDVDPGTGLFRSARGDPRAQPLGFFALALYVKETSNPVAREAANAAGRPLFAGQRPDGAWNADPLDPFSAGRGDLRSTVWCALALRGALQRHFDPPDGAEDALRRAGDAIASFLDPATGAAPDSDGTPGPDTAAAAFALQELGRRDDPLVRKALAVFESCTCSWDNWDVPTCWRASVFPLRDWFFVANADYGNNPAFPAWNKRFLPELLKRQIVVNAAESGCAGSDGEPRDVGWWDSPSSRERLSDPFGPAVPCKRWDLGREIPGETTVADRVRDTCLCALALMVYYSNPPAAAHFEEEVAVLRPPKPDAGPAVVRPTGLKSGDIRVIRKTGRVAP